MKDDYLTLRLPRELTRALARWARPRGLSKSGVVREALLRYLQPPPLSGGTTLGITGNELASRWSEFPRLLPEEAAAWGADLEAARRALPAPAEPWE
jgi:hypothetical protein